MVLPSRGGGPAVSEKSSVWRAQTFQINQKRAASGINASGVHGPTGLISRGVGPAASGNRVEGEHGPISRGGRAEVVGNALHSGVPHCCADSDITFLCSLSTWFLGAACPPPLLVDVRYLSTWFLDVVGPPPLLIGMVDPLTLPAGFPDTASCSVLSSHLKNFKTYPKNQAYRVFWSPKNYKKDLFLGKIGTMPFLTFLILWDSLTWNKQRSKRT